ncbi:fibrous sheath CABYR-binding protein-like [Schistocerca nitens]|uniref:fibrous sheath CABYR-binding protein-like n=1 Tax=Schistocerca nitens TaxID=7011 RepID=UPI00211732B6|nr:fibrous sheath CABYR-binding protein-like [Schistocerca nitens]
MRSITKIQRPTSHPPPSPTRLPRCRRLPVTWGSRLTSQHGEASVATSLASCDPRPGVTSAELQLVERRTATRTNCAADAGKKLRICPHTLLPLVLRVPEAVAAPQDPPPDEAPADEAPADEAPADGAPADDPPAEDRAKSAANAATEAATGNHTGGNDTSPVPPDCETECDDWKFEILAKCDGELIGFDNLCHYYNHKCVHYEAALLALVLRVPEAAAAPQDPPPEDAPADEAPADGAPADDPPAEDRAKSAANDPPPPYQVDGDPADSLKAATEAATGNRTEGNDTSPVPPDCETECDDWKFEILAKCDGELIGFDNLCHYYNHKCVHYEAALLALVLRVPEAAAAPQDPPPEDAPADEAPADGAPADDPPADGRAKSGTNDPPPPYQVDVDPADSLKAATEAATGNRTEGNDTSPVPPDCETECDDWKFEILAKCDGELIGFDNLCHYYNHKCVHYEAGER